MSGSHDNSWSWRGITIWLTCAAFFSYEFLLRTILGTFQPAIMRDLQLNYGEFSLLSSTAYILIYGTMQIPSGIFVDRFGLRRSLITACLICAVSLAGFAASDSLLMALIFRVLTGLGSSFGFVCLLVAVYEYLPANRSAFFIGLSQFIGTMGPMLGAGPFEALASSAGATWHEFFWGLSGVGILIMLIVMLLIPKMNLPCQQGFRLLSTNTSIWRSLLRLFRQAQVWYVALVCGSIYFFLEYLSENQGKHFLALQGFSAIQAGNMISAGWLGYAFGCPSLGYLSDRIARRKPTLAIAALCVIISVSAMLYLSVGYIFGILAFFMLGIGASGQGVGFAIVAEYCDDDNLAAGLAFNNAFISVVSAVLAPGLGFWLAQLAGSGEPSMLDYQLVFVTPIAMAAVGLGIVIFLLRETFTKSARKPFILALE